MSYWKKKIDKSSLLVIGATGDIGSAVSKVLASKFQRIFLMSREINEQSYIFQQALSMNKNTVCVNRISPDLLNNSDVVFVATSAVQAILDPVFLKKGSIVADVSIPANVKSFDRKDVFIFEAGKAKFSFFQDFISEKSSFLFGKNSIYGCLAEALVLGFEKKFESYSVGRGEITDRKIFEISALAKKHGVTLSDLSYGDFYYSRDFNEGIVEC